MTALIDNPPPRQMLVVARGTHPEHPALPETAPPASAVNRKIVPPVRPNFRKLTPAAAAAAAKTARSH
jgi:hypothetical protein